MYQKKLTLSAILGFLSLLLGYTLGQLDFFGFLDNKHALHLTFLLSSFFLWYALSIIIFLLDFSDKKNLVIVYLCSALLFGSAFFLADVNILVILSSILFFFLFLFYVYEATLKRFNIFIKFVPNEIFVPIAKNGFLFLLIILAIMGFFQAQSRQKTNTLITPGILKTLTRPLVTTLNQQLGAQLQQQLGGQFQQAIGTQNREKIVRFVLSETLESMTEGNTRQLFGVRPDNIPIEKTIVYADGTIDLTPVVDHMLPEIAQLLNRQLEQFRPFITVGVAFLVVLFVQPFLVIFHLLFAPLNSIIFYFLFKTELLKKTTVPVEKEIVRL